MKVLYLLGFLVCQKGSALKYWKMNNALYVSGQLLLSVFTDN